MSTNKKKRIKNTSTKIDKKTADKLVSTKVNINDGWADDVDLVYPEDSWKPGDAELVMVSLDDDEAISENEARIKEAEELQKLIKEDSTAKVRRIHPFRLFMIVWIGLLSVSVAIGLNYFYHFLKEYEATYQASRPYHDMDKLMVTFNSMDIDTITNLMTVKPELSEFETEENLKGYIRSLLEGKNIEYSPTSNHADDFPEYYITADGYIVGVINLRKQPTTSLKYNFPEWYVSSFEFYTDAQHSVRVEKPTNYTLCINGIPVDTKYRYEGNIDVGDKQRYFGSRVIIPQLEKYYVNELFEKPYVTAIDCFGNECEVVWNESRGIYEVPFAAPKNMAELEKYCIAAATDYTNWVSQDAEEDIIDKYFEEDSELLKMIKAGTSRKYFTRHTNTNIQNIQVLEHVVYNDKAMYASISLDQHMDVWGQETIVEVQCNFFYLNTDDGWKIISIMY